MVRLIVSVFILIGTAGIRFVFTKKDLAHERVAHQQTIANLAEIQGRQGKIQDMTKAKEGEKKETEDAAIAQEGEEAGKKKEEGVPRTIASDLGVSAGFAFACH